MDRPKEYSIMRRHLQEIDEALRERCEKSTTEFSELESLRCTAKDFE